MTLLLSVILLLFSTDSALAQWVRIDTISYTALFASGDTIIGGYKQVLDPKIRISTNGGLSWLNAVTSMQPDDRIEVFEKHKGNFYAGLVRDIFWDTCSTCGGVYRSTDGGMTWHMASAGIPLQLRADIRTLLDYGDTIFAGGSIFQVPPSLYLSTNAGSQWENIGDTTLNYFGVGTIVSCGGKLFFNGGTSQSPTIWYSTNSGRSWVAGDSGFPSGAKALTLECFGNRLFTVARDFWSYFVLATRTDRMNWRVVHAGLMGGSPGSFASAGRLLFFATGSRVYFLCGNSDTLWKDWSTGLPVYTAVVITVSKRHVNVSGLYGLWQRPLEQVVSVSGESARLEAMSLQLDQNFPNPFNGTTRIRFEIREAQHVSLRVYDLLGREVRIIINERLKSGVHDVIFDGTHMSSGAYVLRLVGQRSSPSRVMFLVR